MDKRSVTVATEVLMVGLNPLVSFLKLIIWTGSVSGERPVSALIIAPPGAGKTSLLEKIQASTTVYCSDLTSREVHNILEKHPKATHILVGDMLSILGHKHSVSSLTLRLISVLTGDTMKTDSYSGENTADRRMGLITAIPPEDLESVKIRRSLQSGGFASRFLLLRYGYKPSTLTKVHKYIEQDRYINEIPDTFSVDPDRWEITIPALIAKKISSLAQALKQDKMGTRLHLHLRALTKARARMAKRNHVNASDFAYVEEACDFFSAEGVLL